jgi:hypothetical protein
MASPGSGTALIGRLPLFCPGENDPAATITVTREFHIHPWWPRALVAS